MKKIVIGLFLVCLAILWTGAESVRERAERLLQQDANSVSGNIAMGIALLDEGKIEPAQFYLEKAVTRRPEIPFVWYLLALIYEKKNENTLAINAWENVLRYSASDSHRQAENLRTIAEKHLKWLKEKF